jgi:Abortive infection C-terminus
MAEAESSPFIMHGARAAIASGLAHIQEQVSAIEDAVVENPGLTFDLARTLVESVCRTILGERAIAYKEEDDLPRLFRVTSQYLPFLPLTASKEVEAGESLRRTLGGLSISIQGICELRNQCGFASYGSDNPRPAMESVQALLAAQAADAIVGFLVRIHRQDRPPPPSPRALYEENATFNNYVDEAHEMIRIFKIEFRPSQVLYEMERETYRVYLAEFNTDTESEDDSPEIVP